jgi:predicted GNAT family N-acyltransferase
MKIRRVASELDWSGARTVRERVFVEEQACPPTEEWDEHDWPSEECVHLIGVVDGAVVATARWRPTEIDGAPAAKLERFAVLSEYRRRGYGRRMVQAAIDDAGRSGYTSYVLHAQSYLEDFYASFGFVRVGAEFTEAGIPHVTMVSGA